MRQLVMLLFMTAPTILSAQSQFSLQPAPPAGAAPAALLGVWGNARQCAAYLAGQDNHPLLHPYHISPEWIRQGPHHCYLSWRGNRLQDGELIAMALAQCGEDDLRDYRLVLRQEGERLRIRWSDDYTTADLFACRQPDVAAPGSG